MSEDDPYDLDSGPDPASVAAATPEPDIEDADNPVYGVGIGPGNLEYLTPRGLRAIQEADVVVGFQTVVDFVADETDADLLTCGYDDEAEALSEFTERVAVGERGTAVLMGDPNHSGYQFLGKVQRAVRRVSERPVKAIPGISSLQIAASRARTPMEDTRFVTLHKSGSLDFDLDRLAEVVGERHLLVLPRPFDLMPGDIAEFLLDSGADESLEALVLERLTHDDEHITRTTLGELSESAGGSGRESTPYSDLSVLAVRAPAAPEGGR
ncbi:cobalt-precorrin-6Y C(5)-methyltransferase [Haloferax mucosum ATCC BAA-1512]|uniref:Cobalt-precorrin-6Y C(5)-methyltransferase n=1 Tax=Haloferax mucosum ATCC BAA-1512 TaxID=662479 RepID=M0IJ36_9EURY|nr:cobalt-precorrin-7 (C(5))-methyltransferase [Haloferax mucosum]ELZ95878.1 cobalt-precorrin-6Y C(5)-methyltransferase [Haloferax mucosum ATCC BAA-1512]